MNLVNLAFYIAAAGTTAAVIGAALVIWEGWKAHTQFVAFGKECDRLADDLEAHARHLRAGGN
jgi:hypothetical protein